MGDETEQNFPADWLKDLSSHSKLESYTAQEMIECTHCRRKTPPNRLDCIYCGVKLELSEEQLKILKPILRNTESWKNAINVVFLSKLSNWNDRNLPEISKMIRSNDLILKQLFDAGKPLPIARAEQQEELQIVVKRLEEIGLKTRVILDRDLSAETPPLRLRKIEFREGWIELDIFNSGDVRKITSDKLVLMVTGALFEKRIESSEKHMRNKANKSLDTAEISVDELVIDLYAQDDPTGFRIFSKGHDFSCLGDEKRMTANQNMSLLVKKLVAFAPNAVHDKDYLEHRVFLGGVWDVDEHKDSKGIKRKAIGGYKRETVTTTNNLSQFTKYSRLKRILYETEK